MPRPSPGRVAFPVIIALGAVTGLLSYMFFSLASPGPLFTPEKVFLNPPGGGPVTGELEEGTGETAAAEAAESEANATNQTQSASIPSDALTITIPPGAAIEGNPAYEPETAESTIDQTIAWKNDDTVPHTSTSGELFDSGLINAGESYSIAAEEIGAGEYEYICTLHPFMTGKLVIK